MFSFIDIEIKNYKNKKGFTLIELLVVITIIGILAAIIFANITLSRKQARESKAMAEMYSIRTAMEMLYSDTGKFPNGNDAYCPPVVSGNNEVDLSLDSAGLMGNDGNYTNWNGPYVANVIDPWGTPYFLDEDYHCTAGAKGCNGFVTTNNSNILSVLVSCGPDKMVSGSNGGACVYNDDNIVLILCGP